MSNFVKIAFTAASLLVLTAAAQAAELVMVDMRACTYCAKFRHDVAPSYNSTAAGQVAPLRTVSPLKKWPSDLAGVKPAPFTPVFILVKDGREVGRFAGYTNAQAFWAKLNPLLAAL
jgi:thioredoxin-related protein